MRNRPASREATPPCSLNSGGSRRIDGVEVVAINGRAGRTASVNYAFLIVQFLCLLYYLKQ